jgi:hypothetical protein
MKTTTVDGYDVRTIYTDSGTIAGYVFKRPTWCVWGAIPLAIANVAHPRSA